MPTSGLFLTTEDAQEVAKDLLEIWYGLVIAGREVTREQKDTLSNYINYFAGGKNPTDTRSDADAYWPAKQELDQN
jgi:hypothetical protein